MNLLEYAARYAELNKMVLTRWQIDMLSHLEMGYGIMITASNMQPMMEVVKIMEDWKLDAMCFPEPIPVQQLIRDEVMPGIHYHTNEYLLDANIKNVLEQMERVNRGDHVMMKKYVEDIDFLKDKLLRGYKKDHRRYIANYVNLIQSEN